MTQVKFAASTTQRARGIMDHLEAVGVPLWPDANKRDRSRMTLIFSLAMEHGEPVRFLNPVCPDYPLNSLTGVLGSGIGANAALFLPIIGLLSKVLVAHRVPFSYSVLVADTESDLPEVVKILAGSLDEFLDRCKATADAIRYSLPDVIDVGTFSEYFPHWHAMQYAWERTVRASMQVDEGLSYWIRTLAAGRWEKYAAQFGRRLTMDECISMAVRHAAQYATLGHWMRQWSTGVMVNTDSPNLRMVRRPLESTEEIKQISSLTVRDAFLRVPVIVVS